MTQQTVVLPDRGSIGLWFYRTVVPQDRGSTGLWFHQTVVLPDRGSTGPWFHRTVVPQDYDIVGSRLGLLEISPDRGPADCGLADRGPADRESAGSGPTISSHNCYSGRQLDFNWQSNRSGYNSGYISLLLYMFAGRYQIFNKDQKR